MPRWPDTVEIQAVDGSGSLDRFTSVSITNDITEPSEAAIEIGDDGTWPDFQDVVALGKEYRCFVNGKLRLTGRIEADDNPADASGGSTTRFTLRTKLADAQYRSAETSISLQNTTIKEFLLQLYAPLGYAEKDFFFVQSESRDLLTGKSSRGVDAPVKLEKMTVEDAKVNPPETIYDAADRHLRRHGLMHWDAPDGRIVIGAPNDTQDPLYALRYSKRGNGHANNVLSATRTKDWSGIPSEVVLHGRGGIRGRTTHPIVSLIRDQDLVNAGFNRPVVIVAEGIKNQSLADKAARRELAARSKNKDNYVFELDGLSFWDGYHTIPWGLDVVASVESDVAAVHGGAYYIHRVVLSRDAQGGDKTNITAVKRGIWRIA